MNDLKAHKLILKARNDMVYHIEEIQGVKLYEPQKRIIRAIEKYDRVSISSCHNLGKTFTMARAALAFGSTRPSKIITTAPTFHQVNHLLWEEMRHGHRHSVYPLGGEMFKTPRWRIDENWYAIGISPEVSGGADEQGEQSSFQGHHALNVLIIFDEAVGCRPPLWIQAEGMLTAGNCKMAVIGNPTSKSGYFYRTWGNRKWHNVSLTCFDSPNLPANGLFSKLDVESELDKLERMARPVDYLQDYKVVNPHLVTAQWIMGNVMDWGIRNNKTLSKCFGEFPITEDYALIGDDVINIALKRTFSGNYSQVNVGIDPNGDGADDFIVTVMLDYHLEKIIRTMTDQVQVMNFIIKMLKEYPQDKTFVIVIDATGVGKGMVDLMRNARNNGLLPIENFVREIHFGGNKFYKKIRLQQHEAARYANHKARSFDKLAKDFKDKITIQAQLNIVQLRKELVEILNVGDTKGRSVIEPKDHFKERTGLSSPDRADSLTLANYGNHLVFSGLGAGAV